MHHRPTANESPSNWRTSVTGLSTRHHHRPTHPSARRPSRHPPTGPTAHQTSPTTPARSPQRGTKKRSTDPLAGLDRRGLRRPTVAPGDRDPAGRSGPRQGLTLPPHPPPRPQLLANLATTAAVTAGSSLLDTGTAQQGDVALGDLLADRIRDAMLGLHPAIRAMVSGLLVTGCTAPELRGFAARCGIGKTAP
jgi:hypothetical protein